MAGLVRTNTCLRCLFKTSSNIQQWKLAPRSTYLTLRSLSTLVRRLQPVSTQQLRALPFRIQLVRTSTIQPPRRSPGTGGRGPITWTFVAILAVLGGLYVVLFRSQKSSVEKAQRREMSYGKAALGGDWTLVDHTGKTVTNKDFEGKWLIIYFGFTHCPDICPDELEKLAETVDLVDKVDGFPSVLPVFISVDPERDTVEAVREYIKEFSSKMIGLTGTKEQVNEICKAYRVYFNEGPRDDDNDYIVDHTIVMYLINPEGEFVTFFGKTPTPMDICNRVLVEMTKYRVLKEKK